MDIKLELLNDYVVDVVTTNLKKLNINADEIVSTQATEVLAEIVAVIRDDSLSDFDVIEKIVCLFEKHKINCGSRHDF